jgi:hypothetical protein
MNEEVVNVKAVDFSILPVGEKFFTSRMIAEVGTVYCIKTETKKLNEGWTNAKSAFGVPSFIKYDARVWVRK